MFEELHVSKVMLMFGLPCYRFKLIFNCDTNSNSRLRKAQILSLQSNNILSDDIPIKSYSPFSLSHRSLFSKTKGLFKFWNKDMKC